MKCDACGKRLAEPLTLAPFVEYGRHLMCGVPWYDRPEAQIK